jgi:hypothetical protein
MKSEMIYLIILFFYNSFFSQKQKVVYKEDFKDFLCYGNEWELYEYGKKEYFDIYSPESLKDTIPINCKFYDGDFKFINCFSNIQSKKIISSEIIGKYQNGKKNGRFFYYDYRIESKISDTILFRLKYCDYVNGKLFGDYVSITYENSDKFKRNKRNRIYYPISILIHSYKNDTLEGVSFFWELESQKDESSIIKYSVQIKDSDKNKSFFKQINSYSPSQSKRKKKYKKRKIRS